MNEIIRDIAVQSVGGILAGAFLALIGVIFLDQTKFRPWVAKYLNPSILIIFNKVTFLVQSKVFKSLLLVVLLFLVYLNIQFYYIVINIALLFISFILEPKKYIFDDNAASIEIGFDKEVDILRYWQTKTGKPELEKKKGNPRPSLKLNKIDNIPTNTFLILKSVKSDRGIIECDIFLDPGSLVNFVFFLDEKNEKWHMARFDTRGSGSSDGFLIKDNAQRVNWRFNKISGTNTNSGTFYKIRLEYNGERARLFRERELLVEIINPEIFGDKIGIFNEVGNVYIDNYTFRSA